MLITDDDKKKSLSAVFVNSHIINVGSCSALQDFICGLQVRWDLLMLQKYIFWRFSAYSHSHCEFLRFCLIIIMCIMCRVVTDDRGLAYLYMKLHFCAEQFSIQSHQLSIFVMEVALETKGANKQELNINNNKNSFFKLTHNVYFYCLLLKVF